eukprot:scaffold5529_cov117-Cylindrotheca_fusiformis.AAC.26
MGSTNPNISIRATPTESTPQTRKKRLRKETILVSRHYYQATNPAVFLHSDVVRTMIFLV